MPEALNLIGRRFGKLLVIAPAFRLDGKTAWTCLCDCGTRKSVRTASLTTGDIKSCSCAKRINDGMDAVQRYHFRHRERILANQRNWNKRNAALCEEYHAKYQRLHAEEIRVRRKTWYHENRNGERERLREAARERRRVLGEPYVIHVLKQREHQYEPTPENIERIRNEIAAKRFRDIAKRIEATRIITQETH